MDARTELLAALRRHSLRTGEFTLASGRTSAWYLDARQVTYRGDCIDTVGRAVLEALAAGHGTAGLGTAGLGTAGLGTAGLGTAGPSDAPQFDSVGGLTLGADPVALAVALVSGRRAFSVRKEAKGHGAGGRMAGPVRPGDRVLVVDDAVTTGGSTLQALDAILEFGGDVVAVACLVDRGGELGAALEARGIPFFPALGAPDLGYAFGS